MQSNRTPCRSQRWVIWKVLEGKKVWLHKEEGYRFRRHVQRFFQPRFSRPGDPSGVLPLCCILILCLPGFLCVVAVSLPTWFLCGAYLFGGVSWLRVEGEQAISLGGAEGWEGMPGSLDWRYLILIGKQRYDRDRAATQSHFDTQGS